MCDREITNGKTVGLRGQLTEETLNFAVGLIWKAAAEGTPEECLVCEASRHIGEPLRSWVLREESRSAFVAGLPPLTRSAGV